MTDRRRHARLDTLVIGTLTLDGVRHQVVCVDISLGGAFLATPLRVRAGQTVDLVLHPPEVTDPEVVLRAEVRYAVDTDTGRPCGVALQWVTADRRALARLLEDLLQAGRATRQAGIGAPAHGDGTPRSAAPSRLRP